jgi:hypothetical protein
MKIMSALKCERIMSWRSSATLSFFAVLCLATWGAQGAEWQNTAPEWTFEYSALSGFRPDECAAGGNLAVSRFGYQTKESGEPAYSSIVMTENGTTALRMINNGRDKESSQNEFSHYRLTGNPYFYKTKTLIVDFKFRIMDRQSKAAQFSVGVSIPVTGTEMESFGVYVSFAPECIKYLTATGLKTVAFSTGFGWHEARIVMDTDKSKFELWIDGHKSPIAETVSLSKSTPRLLKIQFGDGSALVEGAAEIEYFKCAANQIIKTKNERNDQNL